MPLDPILAPILVLITVDPSHPIATHAYRYVKAMLTLQANVQDADAMDSTEAIRVFFYGDAAHTANQLRWQVADRENLTTKWQQLSLDYHLKLPVCVSTALTRGITDSDNAQRHQLSMSNVAQGFELVGLGELAETLNRAKNVMQF